MKSMKLSAIVLGLAAAGALAQTAPAAAPAAAEAAAQPAAQPVAEAPAAEPAAAPAAQPAAEAPAKAEEAQPAAAPAAEPATVAAPKAEEAKVAEEPKKEEAVKAEEPKAEEKKEEVAKAEEPKVEEKKEEAKAEEAAGLSITERLNISKADAEPEAKKAKEFKVSGQAEFDTYADWRNDSEQDLYHHFQSTFDLDFQVNFNENWSAQVEIEADGDGSSPSVYYNGAFVQYQKNENFAIKFGDLTYAEGAFNYYGYDDPAYNAAGMAEHDVRGIELDLYGLQLAIGLTRNSMDFACSRQYYYSNGEPVQPQDVCRSYDIHGAYQLEFAGQTLRPFVHYQNWQHGEQNEFHAGLDAALEFGPIAIHAVYGLHKDDISKSSPEITHAFLAEPSFKVANVTVKGGFFYAKIEESKDDATIHIPEIPEYMFGYGEGIIKFCDAIALGAVGELHTNSLDVNTDLGSLNFGLRSYFTPVDGLEVTGFIMAILPMGDDWEKDFHSSYVSTVDYGEDLNLNFGVEAIFSF